MTQFIKAGCVMTLLFPALAQAQQCAVPPTSSVSSPVYSEKASVVPAQPDTSPVAGDSLNRLMGYGVKITQKHEFHGFETGIAYTKERVFIYFMPADHKAVLGGTVIPVPYDVLLSLSGRRATELKVWDGIRGFFLQNGQHFQVIYATPDGQAAIAGALWDAAGHNITRRQIQAVPGAVPVVQMKSGDITQTALTSLHGGEIGKPGAPEAVMLIDPQCMYSIRAAQALLPQVEAGRLRLKIVPVSLLDYEDKGESTRNAQAMLSFAQKDRASAWLDQRLAEKADSPDSDAVQKLAWNGTFAHNINLKGTPTFLWIRQNGTLGRYEGNPADVQAFVSEVAQ